MLRGERKEERRKKKRKKGGRSELKGGKDDRPRVESRKDQTEKSGDEAPNDVEPFPRFPVFNALLVLCSLRHGRSLDYRSG